MSQQSTKGITAPNRSKVIHTNSKIDEGSLQEFMVSQHSNYEDWSGQIKIPTILQSAKKCAKFSAETKGARRPVPPINKTLLNTNDPSSICIPLLNINIPFLDYHLTTKQAIDSSIKLKDKKLRRRASISMTTLD